MFCERKILLGKLKCWKAFAEFLKLFLTWSVHPRSLGTSAVGDILWHSGGGSGEVQKEVGDPKACVPADMLGDIRHEVSISDSVSEILLRLRSR